MPHRLLICALLLAGSAALAQTPSFTQTLYPILQKANCRNCHNDSGVASATGLHFPEPDAATAQIEAFGKGLAALVDRNQPEASLLYNKPTGRIQHTGGRLIAHGSPEETALLEWVRYLAKLPAGAVPGAPTVTTKAAPVVMRRLTHAEYNRTVRDLLGDQTSPANQFPPEDFVNGFKNQADAQSLPALLTEAYGASAERLARNAFRNGDTNNLVPCKPQSGRDAKCRAQFVREFGLKAFRRPLAAKEVERYGALFNGETDFYKGAQLVMEAMLQSPHFLFRAESSRPVARPYEIATRLAYFLWDTMPDERLFRAASSGELNTAAGIEKAARWMVADPKARPMLDEFIAQWLRFDRVLNTVRDRRQFPMFSPEVAAAMTEEARLLIADAVWNDRDFMTVFTADYGFLNADLASLYRFPAPPADFQRASFPANTDRAGILGQAAFLTLTSKPIETSPTARGLFVREQFLCQHVPDPPPGTNATLPPVAESKPQTNRERLAEHLSNASCSTCHRLIDSIGFGLEKFDAIGARREKLTIVFQPGRKETDKGPRRVELDLDTNGAVAGIPDSAFSSPKDLGRVLAASPQCQQCVVKQMFRFGYGRPETAADRATIDAVSERFRASAFKFREMLVELASAYGGELVK